MGTRLHWALGRTWHWALGCTGHSVALGTGHSVAIGHSVAWALSRLGTQALGTQSPHLDIYHPSMTICFVHIFSTPHAKRLKEVLSLHFKTICHLTGYPWIGKKMDMRQLFFIILNLKNMEIQ